MKIRTIGLDFDGVICNTNFYKSKFFENNFNLLIAPCNLDKTSMISYLNERFGEEKAAEILALLKDNLILSNMAPIYAAKEYIKKLSENFRVVIVTARHLNKVDAIEQWLKENRIEGISGIFSCEGTSKAEICEKKNIDVLVDDDSRHSFSKLPDFDKLFVLFKYPKDELRLKTDDKTVFNWKELYDFLTEQSEMQD